jgi:hypothetical protein
MVKNAASRKHKHIQATVKNVIDNIQTPRGWILQRSRCEDSYEFMGRCYKPDVMVKWANGKGEKFILFIEVQNNLTEPSFLAKSKDFVELAKRGKGIDYIIIEENKCPDNWLELEEYVEQQIPVPW